MISRIAYSQVVIRYALHHWVSHRVSELTAGGVTGDVFSEYLHREDPAYPSPSWTGRVTEVFWMHGGQPIGTYALNYDGFGRLRDGWHYLYGNPVNEWSERSITYDFGARFYDPLTARWLTSTPASRRITTAIWTLSFSSMKMEKR